MRIPRNTGIMTMVGRKSGSFKDQRAGRGGAKNEKASFLEEYEDSHVTPDEDVWDDQKTKTDKS